MVIIPPHAPRMSRVGRCSLQLHLVCGNVRPRTGGAGPFEWLRPRQRGDPFARGEPLQPKNDRREMRFHEKDVGPFAGVGRRRLGLGLPDPTAAERSHRRSSRRRGGRAHRLRSHARQRRRRVGGCRDRRGIGGNDRRRLDAAARPTPARPTAPPRPANARAGATITTATASAWRITERPMPRPGTSGIDKRHGRARPGHPRDSA